MFCDNTVWLKTINTKFFEQTCRFRFLYVYIFTMMSWKRPAVYMDAIDICVRDRCESEMIGEGRRENEGATRESIRDEWAPTTKHEKNEKADLGVRLCHGWTGRHPLDVLFINYIIIKSELKQNGSSLRSGPRNNTLFDRKHETGEFVFPFESWWLAAGPT